MVTIRDIAARVGVSRTTVSHALLGRPRISSTTRARVQQAALELGYRPNPILAQLMAQLRVSRGQAFRGKLALINANADRRALQQHPTIPTYLEGCERRATQLGYSFDRFWLHDTGLTVGAWKRILETRDIKGLLVVGLMDQAVLPPRLAELWQNFPCVVTGVRTRSPALSFSCVDHYHLALTAFERALELGYRKPALVLDGVIDQLVDGRFSAGILAGQEKLPRDRRAPAFTRVGADGQVPAGFERWLAAHQPDVVLVLYNTVLGWLKKLGYRVPQDIGVIQLEWRAARPDVAGMNQHNDVVGEAAVEMLIGQVVRQEVGVAPFPRATLIGATWVDGPSAPRKKAKRSGD